MVELPVDPYYTDIEVAKLLDPSGRHIKPRSIRSEREAGRLVGTRVAGKWLYRKSDVLAFLEAARVVPRKPQDVAVPRLDAANDGRLTDGQPLAQRMNPRPNLEREPLKKPRPQRPGVDKP